MEFIKKDDLGLELTNKLLMESTFYCNDSNNCFDYWYHCIYQNKEKINNVSI